MKKLQIGLVIFLLLGALAVRIYNIQKVPPSLYIDEADYGLQAQSLIHTFADYRGELTPFWVHSFNDIRAPIPAYFTAVTSLIFDQPELQVRASSALLGTLVVLIIFFLVKLWTKNFIASFLTAATFAANPWQIQFSRWAHEGIFMMAFYLAGIFLFFKALETKKYKFLILFSILLSVSVYTYRPMSLFVPLTFIILFLLFHKDLLTFGLKKLALLVFLTAGIILPFLYATTVGAPDQPRITQLSIFSDPAVPVWVQRNREVDSGDFVDPTIGKKPALSSFFFHSKPISWLDSFANNYFSTFSTEFLFMRGDRNLRHAVGQMGHLYFVDILALIFGFIFLVENFSKKEYRWLTIWLLISPIPASLTIDGAQHAARLFIFSAPLLLVTGLGWWKLYQTFGNLKYARLVLFVIVGVWFLLVIFYLHRYFVHYPIESARSFGYGFKQAMLKISQVESDYRRIAMVLTKDPPMIYYLFWSKTSPKLIQEYGTNFSQEVKKDHPLDKYKVIDWPSDVGKDQELARYLRSDTLYLVTQHELPLDLRSQKPPLGIELVDLIKYPDNEVTFYLITRDPKYKTPPSQPKFGSLEL